jgi:PadR family transcriptional regulator, regulatory protein PadR
MAQDKIAGDILKGHVATMVLGVIGDHPRHGYDIMKTLSERSRGAFALGQGTIYPLLYSLEEEGLVKSSTAVVDGRTRRVYALTIKGRRSLADRRETWHALQAAINSVLQPARMEVPSHV